MKTIPWLTDDAITFLDNFCRNHVDATILEFGMGGSTIWFSQKTKNLTSVEHDPSWFNKVVDYLKTHSECNPVATVLHPRPYNIICNGFLESSFDLILVDGRDRVKCVESCHRLIKPGGILMLDNAERCGVNDSDYRPIYTILKDWKLTRTTNKEWDTNWWVKP